MDSIKYQEPNKTYKVAKRILDILFSSIALVMFSPIIIFIILLIKLESPGPVFFRQERIGENGRKFIFLKFRTMYYIDDNEHRAYLSLLIHGSGSEIGEDTLKIPRDPRLTKIGRFLRRTALDELPQFVIVLKGDMSLVGPRPPIPYEVELYDEWHKERLKAKPGITGLWQMQPDFSTTFDEMVKLDIQYVRTRSLLLDLKILFLTPIMILFPSIFAKK
jgi:lipopolysaccharide/colanic/teichoic acid biosynthesis glycosyltransferase